MCEVCKKVFNRKDNLERHQRKHDSDNTPDCLNPFISEEAINRHLKQEHGWHRAVKRSVENQEGGGAANRQKLAEDPSRFYDIKKIGERKIEMFKTTATYYQIHVKDVEITNLPDILKYLKNLFQDIISRMTEDIPSNDLVRLSMDNPELDFPIVLRFMRMSELTVDRILLEIERVLQSYEQFVVDETFNM